MRKYTVTLLLLFLTIAASGCASQSDFRALRSDVDALQAQLQQASNNASQALELSNQLVEQNAVIKKASEKASADASATRELLEKINSRIGNAANKSAFK